MRRKEIIETENLTLKAAGIVAYAILWLLIYWGGR
jgi:hypothetical protein